MSGNIKDLLKAQAKRLQATQRATLGGKAAGKLVDQLRRNGATTVTLERATTGERKTCVGYWLYDEKKVRVS